MTQRTRAAKVIIESTIKHATECEVNAATALKRVTGKLKDQPDNERLLEQEAILRTRIKIYEGQVEFMDTALDEKVLHLVSKVNGVATIRIGDTEHRFNITPPKILTLN